MSEWGIHRTFPTIIDAAAVVTRTGPNSSFRKLVFPLKRHVEDVAAEAAIDGAQIAI
jgi:hypothetical protein